MNPNFFDVLAGYKTYVAAIGLFGLGVYQISQGDFNTAFQTIMAALAAFGVRSAIGRNEVAFKQFKVVNESALKQLKATHEALLSKLDGKK